MKIYKHIFLFFIPTVLLGQTLSGYVRDFEQLLPLAYTNILIEGTYRGTTSNRDGFYQMKLKPGNYDLLFQFMGYSSKTITVQIDTLDVNLNIDLQPQVLPFDAIAVYADQKSEAELLILKASEQKRISRRYIRNYACHSYCKTSYRSALKDRIAYGGISETYSKLTFNAPHHWCEQVLSQKQSANIPESLNMIAGNTFLDINADRIDLGDKQIIGPTASDGIAYYRYEIVDTLYQDDLRIYEIGFSPQNRNIPAMSGTLYLVDRYFIIKKIDAHLNEACDYDMFENIHIIQTYRTIEDSLFLPEYSFRESKFVIDIPEFPPMLVRKENFRENYNLNNDDNLILADMPAVIFMNSMPFDSATMYFPPLNADEARAYVQIDSLVRYNATVRLMTATFKTLDKYAALSGLPVGPFSEFFRFNKVEGVFTGFSLDSKGLFKQASFSTGLGYGWSDRKFKYSIASGLHLPTKRYTVNLTLDAYNRLATRESLTIYPMWMNTLKSIFQEFDYFDYYYASGYRCGADLLLNRWVFRANYRNEYHTEADRHVTHGLFHQHAFAPNVEMATGKQVGFEMHVAYSDIQYRKSNLETKMIPNQNYWQCEWGLQTGVPGWGSDFDFVRLEMLLFLGQNTYHNGFFEASLLLGTSWGNLSSQYLFELASGHTGYRIYNAFATLKPNSMAGKTKCAVFLEHNFHDSIFRLLHFPVTWEFSLIYNSGWVGNRTPDQLMYNAFYSEAGFGLNKILNLIKLNFIWRTREITGSQLFYFNVEVDDFDIF